MEKINKILEKVPIGVAQELKQELAEWIPPIANKEDLPEQTLSQYEFSHGTQPAIPWKGKCFTIPKNLKGESSYLMGTGRAMPTQNMSANLFSISCVLNNITEILTYISQKRIGSLSASLNKELKDLENRTISNLEINRTDIKSDLEKQISLNKENLKGLEIATERLERLFLESRKEQISKDEIANLTQKVKEMQTFLNDKL
ncbi:putative aphid transmission factor [Cestrum yellow leaf curling virus]|uniref:Uncharacterized protein 2 n=1 Tax=Cestrum yellow leaf curling virus TaxID=175814 RepID=Y2_CYLCV|nr:putative aphid transmission factor [Cestrum yellow leaf curling virus]Q7TD11.1 RecName: Full=Uncharacterized protein 2 [Cestrum yellow leaf curling virus]AAP78921.1 putative aphid transmission factor [Cestrum yellow leaf curling virus]